MTKGTHTHTPHTHSRLCAPAMKQTPSQSYLARRFVITRCIITIILLLLFCFRCFSLAEMGCTHQWRLVWVLCLCRFYVSGFVIVSLRIMDAWFLFYMAPYRAYVACVFFSPSRCSVILKQCRHCAINIEAA